MRPPPASLRTLVAVGGLLATGSAEGRPVAGGELRVTRTASAADCPDEATLAEKTLALGSAPLDATPAPLTVNVELDRDETGYIARIVATGRKTGQRELRAAGETCAELTDVTSVALAILFDLLPPEPSDPPPLAAPVKPVETPPPAAPPRKKPRPTTPNSANAEPFGSARAYGAFAYGLLGNAVTGEVGGAFHVRLGRSFDVGAGGFWAPGRTLAYDPGTVSVSLVAARLELTAWLAAWGSVALGARLELGVGSLQAAGHDFDSDRTPAELWLAAGAGAVGRLDLSRRWALRAGISGFLPLRAQTFSVQGVPGTAFESSPAALFVDFGPELVFF